MLGYSSLITFVGFETLLIQHWPSKVKFMTHHGRPQSPYPWGKKNKRTPR